MANKALTSLGATATCSNVGGSPSEQIPANAIDANPSTYVLVPTNGDITAQWCKVDLGAAFLIHRFRATFVNSTWTPGSYRIESSVDNVVWISRYYAPIHSGLDTGTLSLFTPVTARYWRIRPLSVSAGGTGIGPSAFELDDAAGTPPGPDPEDNPGAGEMLGNVALSSLGATATHNRSNHQGTVAGNAIDNNEGTYSLIQNPTGQWLRVDLGSAKYISGFQVEWVNSSWYSADYYIESSVDDSVWEEQHHATGQGATGTDGPTSLTTGATARYWRIRNVTAPGEGMGPTTFALHEGTEPPVQSLPPKFINSVPYVQNGTADSITVTVPAEVEDGDVLIFVSGQQPARANHPALGHVPAGWTTLSVINGDSPTHVYWKRWATGDPAGYTFSYFGGVVFGVAQLLLYRRADPAVPVVGYALAGALNTASPATPTFDPTDWSDAGPARLILIYTAVGARPRNVSTAPPSSALVAQQLYVASRGSMQVWDKTQTSKTSVAAQTAVYDTAQESHAIAVLLAPEASTVVVEGAASVAASAAVVGALVQATPGAAAVTATATVSLAADVMLGSIVQLAATAAVEAAGSVERFAAAVLEASGQLSGSAALATQAAGQPLSVTATMAGSMARVIFGAGDPLLATAEIEADGKFAVPGAASIIATFDFELVAGLIMFAEGDIYAFGELEQVLFAQVRRKAAGDLEADFDVTLAGFVRMAASGSATGTAEITKAFAGRERRDAPTLLAQAIATLAARSGPGGHAVVFPSAVMTGALVQGTNGATDITAEGKIEDFAPGAVVYRIASASIFGGASATGTARRDTAAAGALTASVAMIGGGGLLQRAVADPGASGAVELDGAVIAIGGAGALSAPVLLVGAALRTIYENRHLHVEVVMTGAARRETFAVSGLEGAGVNVVATGGYEQRGAADLVASAAVAGPTAGYLVKGEASLVATATASLDQVLLGSSGVLAVTGDLEGSAPLTRIAAGDLVATADVVADGGYAKSAAAAITATATVELEGASLALGASASLFVFGLVLGTVAPFQLGEGELVASVTVAESGAVRLLGSRVFIHAEAFVWPRGGFPIDGSADLTVGADVAATVA